MNTELIFAGISFGIALINSIAVAGMYVQNIRNAWNVFYQIRADENGKIEINDPFSLFQKSPD